MSSTVTLPPFSLRAAVGAIDEEARTVELIFSTGAPVERYDWMSGKRYLERLSLDPAHMRLDRLNAGAPLLDTHNSYSVMDQLGAVEPGSVVLKKKEARATVRFSKRPEVDGVWSDVRDGIVRNVSVGYRVHKFEEMPGKKDNELPTRTAVDWEPYEISMVPMGADSGARVRADNTQPNPCVIVTRAQEDMMDQPTASSAAPAAPAPAPAPAAAAPAAPAPAAAEATRSAEAATLAERERAATIRRAVALAKLPVTLADDLVGRGVTVDAARAEILEKMATASDSTVTQQHTRVEGADDARDKWVRGVAAWIINKAGMVDVVRLAQKARPDSQALAGSFDAGEFRGLSLLDLARQSLERRGVKTAGMDKLAIAGLALRDITGVQTTSDFAVALENVLNKVLLAQYAITPDTWRKFCSTGSVTDFRPHPRYRSGFLSRLSVVPEGGEYTNKAIPDAYKESLTATTKGNIISLSRQAIINDDMSIFSRLAQQIGRAVALSIEMDVYDLIALNAGLGPTLNDGLTLFHATHLNIGTGAAISVAAIDADRVVMASQKDPASNEILDLRPAVLVLPVGLGGQARVINQAQYDTDIVANKPMLTPNKVVGLFRDIVDTPRQTGTRRYLFADPALMPVIEVAFLDGVQDPFLEMQEGWRVDGIEWKARLDYAVGAVEFRGAVTNAGV